MKDITPKRFRCDGVSPFCPGAWQDEDGNTIFRGTLVNEQGRELSKYERHLRMPAGFLEAMFEEWLKNRE